MRNLSGLSMEKILSIEEPELLFSHSNLMAKQEYKQLVLRWHPDQTKPKSDIEKSKNSQVFNHILKLYQMAQKHVNSGLWNEPVLKIEEEIPGIRQVRLKNNLIKSIDCITCREFELGKVYIGKSSITYQIKEEYYDLFLNGRKRILALNYADQKMQLEMSKNLPKILDEFQTKDTYCMSLYKSPEQIFLSDILSSYPQKQRLEIVHLAWILNSLFNIACYLSWQNIAHNAILVENILVSPLNHSVALIGDWWYSTEFGAPFLALNERSMDIIPKSIISSRRTTAQVDLELIKHLAREVLGSVLGNALLYDETIPKNLAHWLNLPSTGRARTDYAEWKYSVLPQIFPETKFFHWHIDTTNFYKEI